MKNEKAKKLVYMALFMALTTVATMIIRISSPTGGYVNAGDAVVLLGAFLLGPIAGTVTAGTMLLFALRRVPYVRALSMR